MTILKATPNRYGGIYVAPDALAGKLGDLNVFKQVLKASLLQWKEDGLKVVWFKLNNDQASYLPALYTCGFENHHCDNNSIMLTIKLQQDALVPDYANHTIGIGGLVINQNSEVLTVREQGHIKSHPHNWKFPGGMIDPYEHIEDAVKREVFEETGVETEFVSFIGFRHHHAGQFQTSNIYGICRLNPLSHEIKIQESEIYDAKWCAIDEYLNDEKIGQYNKFILRSALKFPGLKSINLPGYMNTQDDYEVFMSVD